MVMLVVLQGVGWMAVVVLVLVRSTRRESLLLRTRFFEAGFG